jgi:hypothetical protein
VVPQVSQFTASIQLQVSYSYVLMQMARTQKNKATSGHLGLLKVRLLKSHASAPAMVHYADDLVAEKLTAVR